MKEPYGSDIYCHYGDGSKFLDIASYLLLYLQKDALGVVSVQQRYLQAHHYSDGPGLGLKTVDASYTGYLGDDDPYKVQESIVGDRVGSQGRECGTNHRPVRIRIGRDGGLVQFQSLPYPAQGIGEISREFMLDLHAGNGNGMHTFRHPGISGTPSLFFSRDVFDPYEHRRLVEPEIIAYLGEHGIRGAQDHQRVGLILYQGSSHDRGPELVGKECLTYRFHLGGRLLGGCTRDDTASVYKKSVVYQISDVVCFRYGDSSCALTGTGLSYKSNDSYVRECFSCELLIACYIVECVLRRGFMGFILVGKGCLSERRTKLGDKSSSPICCRSLPGSGGSVSIVLAFQFFGHQLSQL